LFKYFSKGTQYHRWLLWWNLVNGGSPRDGLSCDNKLGEIFTVNSTLPQLGTTTLSKFFPEMFGRKE
jgi:hypothetical protein